jgi:hypothetical protein
MDDTTSGWHFLVARGRHTGYRTLLAPDFLTARRLQGQISDNAGAAGPPRLHQTNIDSPEVGPLTLIYRNERLAPSDLDGHASNASPPVTDEHGRPLELLYGIVTRRRPNAPPDERDLATARIAALNSYQRFLADEDAYDVETSTALALHTPLTQPHQTPATTPPRTRPSPTPSRPGGSSLLGQHRRPIAAGASVVVVVVGVLLGVLVLWPSSNARVEVLAAKVVPSRGTVGCGAPVRFTLSATIHALEKSRVDYRWEPAELVDKKSRNGSLDLRANERKRITASATRAVSRDKPKGSFRLVVAGHEHTLTYDLRCAPGAR